MDKSRAINLWGINPPIIYKEDKMKITDKQIDIIIEIVLEEADYEVEVTGYHDYDVSANIDKTGRDKIRQNVRKFLKL